MSLKLGEQRAARMRRVGQRHALVMPAAAATLVDMELLRRQLQLEKQDLEQLEQRVHHLRQKIADRTAQLQHFESLPIERHDDDPQVV